MSYEKIIHTDALLHNWQVIRRRATAKKIWAVIKSNGYGHGMLKVARALLPVADGFAVARLGDAKTLRAAIGVDKPVLLLQGIHHADEVPALAVRNITPVIHSAWQLDAMRSELSQLHVYLKINTGMNRLGFAPSDVAAAISQLTAARSLTLMTHFAQADEAGKTAMQQERFLPFRNLGYEVSMSNSAAALFLPDLQDDWARVGIALYGSSPAPQQESRNAIGLQAAMTARSQLLAINTIAKGEAVGYGAQFVAPETMPVGIVGCGYGDGYPRAARGCVSINSQQAPLVGRVSMDMLAIDLRNIPNAKVNDEVTLWGSDINIDEVATAANTIPYELLTHLRTESLRLDMT